MQCSVMQCSVMQCLMFECSLEQIVVPRRFASCQYDKILLQQCLLLSGTISLTWCKERKVLVNSQLRVVVSLCAAKV